MIVSVDHGRPAPILTEQTAYDDSFVYRLHNQRTLLHHLLLLRVIATIV